MLYERLLKSLHRDKAVDLATQGHEIKVVEDIIKYPLVLEFLGLPVNHLRNGSKLEQALINNLQNFLLELGKGFSFVERQKKITLDLFRSSLILRNLQESR